MGFVLWMQLYKFKVPTMIIKRCWITFKTGKNLRNQRQMLSAGRTYAIYHVLSNNEWDDSSRYRKGIHDNDKPSVVRKCINRVLWDHRQYLPCSGELCSIGQLIIREKRIVIPKKPRLTGCYTLPMKVIWASLEPSKSSLFKYGGLIWKRTLRSASKPAMDSSWQSIIQVTHNL